jgi:BirA family biotin operon repressor/biotin-[acetyl-CoA-carboxylase] ligase
MTFESSGFRHLHFAELPSTNDYAKSLAQSEAIAKGDKVLISADRQTAGRGQFDRDWQSPSGGLYLSMLLWPEASRELWAELSLLTAGVLKTVLEHAGMPKHLLCVKPPNDLYLDTRKLAGILLETETPASWVVIGVGINLRRNAELSPEYACVDDFFELETDCFTPLVLDEFFQTVKQWEQRHV